VFNVSRIARPFVANSIGVVSQIVLQKRRSLPELRLRGRGRDLIERILPASPWGIFRTRSRYGEAEIIAFRWLPSRSGHAGFADCKSFSGKTFDRFNFSTYGSALDGLTTELAISPARGRRTKFDLFILESANPS